MAEQNVIEIVIKAVDQMSADLKKVQDTMGKMQGGVASLGAESKQTGQSLNALNTVFTGMGAVMTPIIGSSNQLTGAVSRLGQAFMLLKQGAPALAFIGIGAAALALAKNFTDMGVEFGKMSRITGFSIGTLSALKDVAEANDSSLQNITSSLRFFNRNLSEATRGSLEARGVFLDMGLSLKEISEGMKDPEKLFERVANAIVGMSSAADQNRFTMRLFGRNASDIIPILQDVATKGLEKVRKESEAMGTVWDDKMVAAAKRVNAQISLLKKSFEAMTIYLGEKSLPVLNAVLKTMLELAGVNPPIPITEGPGAGGGRIWIPGTGGRKSPPRQALTLEQQLSLLKGYEEGLELAGGKITKLPEFDDAQRRALAVFTRGLVGQQRMSAAAGEATKMGLAGEIFTGGITLDMAIEEFVRKFNETAQTKITPARFAKYREAIINALSTKIILAEEAKALAARTIALTTGVAEGEDLGILPVGGEETGRISVKRRVFEGQSAVAGIQSQGMRAVLQSRLDMARAMEEPYSKILELARKIDEFDKSNLEVTISRKEEEIDLARVEAERGLKKSEELDKLDAELESLKQRREIIAQAEQTTKKQIQDQAESMADTLAGDFTDKFLSIMEGKATTMGEVFRGIGKTIVTQLLQGAIAQMLVSPLLDMLSQMTGQERKQAGRGGLGGMLLGGFKSIFSLFGLGGGVPIISGGEYGKGGILPGNFMPIGALRKFAAGGMASGPTLGMIGEEGPEIVARMKPARPGDMGGGDIKQNIYLVDSRPPRLGPQDVVLYIAADMRAGGKTADAVQNVLKRT